MTKKELQQKQIGLLTYIKDVYIRLFPDDELGQELREELTFAEAFASLIKGENFYKTIFKGGVFDSLVRERIFEILSILTEYSYDTILELWLDSKTEVENQNRGNHE